jgi:hypothetical protein
MAKYYFIFNKRRALLLIKACVLNITTLSKKELRVVWLLVVIVLGLF